MSSFDALLKKAKAAPRESEVVPVTVSGELVELKFYQLPGDKWAGEAVRFPARPGVALDRQYGYNMHELVKAAAKVVDATGEGEERLVTEHYGVRLEKGKDVPLTDEQWDGLFSILSGSEFGNIVDAVWGLNEWLPSQRVAAAKKASPRA